jgi:hypothetical protein
MTQPGQFLTSPPDQFLMSFDSRDKVLLSTLCHSLMRECPGATSTLSAKLVQTAQGYRYTNAANPLDWRCYFGCGGLQPPTVYFASNPCLSMDDCRLRGAAHNRLCALVTGYSVW